jgi:putative ABC transport system permease protein
VSRLLGVAVWRHALRHPVQLALAVLGIALGVAVVVSIDLANASAQRAFELSAEGLAGRATPTVEAGPAGLPEQVYVDLRRVAGVRGSAPVVAGPVALLDHPGRTLTLLGLDPFADGSVRSLVAAPGEGGAAYASDLLTRPGSVLLSAPVARALGVAAGDPLALRAAGHRVTVTVAGLLQPADELARQTLEGLLVADVSTAQEVLGMVGRLSRIDLALAGEADLDRVRAALPAGLRVGPAASRAPVLEQMTRAFRLNLTMLSLLALLVGVFLIYNTMTFSVVQRRALFGTLRALGATRGEVFAAVLGEALLVGAVGTVLGLLLGVVLADGFLALVTRTINDLYFALQVRDVRVEPLSVAKGVLLGLVATAAAAALPAREATQVPPRATLARSTLESGLRRRLPAAALSGGVLLTLSAVLLALPGGGLAAGFVALFGVILGFTLLTPGALLLVLRPLPALLARVGGVPGPLAVRGVSAGLSRTGVAVAALMVAVATTVGVGVMVDSFRRSVAEWLGQTLRADLYLSAPAGGATRSGAAMDPGLVGRVAAVPGVAAVSTARNREVSSSLGPVRLSAFALVPASYAGFRLLEGDARTVWPLFETQERAVVSESFAYRHGVGVGARLTLATDRGERAFDVVGVYRDYGSDQGVVAISRGTYDRYWDDPGVAAIGVYAAPGADLEALADRLRGAVGAEDAVVLQSNRDVRQASLAVFDRTFAITLALRGLATLVAFVGVLSALMALELERGKEVAVLRAMGATRGQVWGLVLSQTGLLGALAGLFAVPLGLTLALILIHVINRRSFGWTLDLHVDPQLLLQAVALAVLAALLAGLYPALRMAGTSPARALREE